MTNNIHLIMPMAGHGARFAENGFDMPKPLIEIGGKPFFYWAAQSIVKFLDVKDLIFVVLEEHIKKYRIDEKIRHFYPQAQFVALEKVLPGAVLTCLAGTGRVRDEAPVIFNDCDHVFTCRSFYDFCRTRDPHMGGGKTDGALLTFPSDSEQFSYIRYDFNKKIIGTVEKKAVSEDAICGAYYFKSRTVFKAAFNAYKNQCQYQEYFLSGLYDIMAKSGGVIRQFRTDMHIGFGTPEEYEKAQNRIEFHQVER